MMTLNIPDDIEQQLKIIANNKQLVLSEFVLSLLTTALKQQEENETVSCFDLMQDGLGCIDDAPIDLSVNKSYLSGYGK
jgi:hypothetical protein